VEFNAVWNTLVSSPPKPAFPNVSKLTVFPEGGGAAAVTEIVALPDLLESASLVAVTVSVPALDGAVYSPEAVMLPSAAFQVTLLSEAVPCTLALNCRVVPSVVEVEAGDTVTDVIVGFGVGAGAAVTITTAEADLVVSATLVAVTVAVPALAGAVYSPEGVMLPSEADQVTDLLDVDPWTEAVKESVPPVADLAETGEMVTEVTAGPGGGGFGLGLGFGATATVTGAEADRVGSATLVAVTTPVPAVAGAVNSPVDVIVPIVADQVTEWSVVVP